MQSTLHGDADSLRTGLLPSMHAELTCALTSAGVERIPWGATQILGKLVTCHLHRLYVTDAAFRPIGIVTLTDILRAVMAHSQ